MIVYVHRLGLAWLFIVEIRKSVQWAYSAGLYMYDVSQKVHVRYLIS